MHYSIQNYEIILFIWKSIQSLYIEPLASPTFVFLLLIFSVHNVHVPVEVFACLGVLLLLLCTEQMSRSLVRAVLGM